MQRGTGEAGGRSRGKAATRLKALKNEILVCPGRADMTAGLQLMAATIADVETKLAVRTLLGAPVVNAVDNRATLSRLLDVGYATDAICMLRWHAHIEKQRALAKFSDEAVHGKPGTYFIALGDWGCSGHGGRTASAALRGQPPGMTMTLIDVLQSRGHIIGVVPKAYKSRHCSHPGCTGTLRSVQ